MDETSMCGHAYCSRNAQFCRLERAVGFPPAMPDCTCAPDRDRHAWHDKTCAFDIALAVLVPEPPDKTRIEFVYYTDVYAMWRDDDASGSAGWTFGDGAETWVEYGGSVPRRWTQMVFQWGPDPLRRAIRLIPAPEQPQPDGSTR